MEFARLVATQHRRAAAALTQRSLQVTPAQARALMVLFQAKAPLTAQQLSHRLGCSEATMARVVHRLREGGWLKRKRHPKDRRMWMLTPTDQARHHLPDFAAVSNELFDEVFTHLDAADLEDLLITLRKLRLKLEAC